MTVPGPNPVMAVPGLIPRSPFRTVGPVFVTVDPPSTANVPAVPRSTAWALVVTTASPRTSKERSKNMFKENAQVKRIGSNSWDCR